MKSRTIKEILMDRDGMSSDDADDLINLAKDELMYYLDIGDQDGAEQVPAEFFGLEPDYVIELLPPFIKRM